MHFNNLPSVLVVHMEILRGHDLGRETDYLLFILLPRSNSVTCARVANDTQNWPKLCRAR